MLAMHKQRGISPVLLLILMVAGIIGLAYFIKSAWMLPYIEQAKALIMPSEEDETASRFNRPAPIPITPRQTTNNANNSSTGTLSGHYVSPPPEQQYYDRAQNYSVPTTPPPQPERRQTYEQPSYTYVPQRKYVPQRVTTGNNPPPNAAYFSYDVQMLSTTNEKAANDAKIGLQRDGYSAFIEPVWRGSVRMFRVKIGRYRTQQEAIALRDNIRRRYPSQYAKSIVVRSDK